MSEKTENDDRAAQIGQDGPYHDVNDLEKTRSGEYKDNLDSLRSGSAGNKQGSTTNPFKLNG